MYDCLILIDPDADVSLDAFEAEVRRFYAALADGPDTIERQGGRLTLTWPTLTFVVRHNAAPSVQEESAEMAACCSDAYAGAARVPRCAERLELSSRGQDPDMLHFNDMLFLIHAAEAVGRVYPFDPYQGLFMDDDAAQEG